MDPAWAEEKAKIKQGKTREAIALALDGQWEKATQVNRGILQLFPDDVDSMNRLGKALLELGRYSAARAAFESAISIAPYNTIAKKNVERLAHLEETESLPKQAKAVTPYLFIEESGKSTVTLLQTCAPLETLAKMAAGDSVKLEPAHQGMVVKNHRGEYLGRVQPKLGMRLVRLIKGGNRYNSVIISINSQEISVILSETYRHPDMANVCSFPTKSREEYKIYWRDALLRYDIDAEREEDEELASDWRESYANGMGLNDDQEPAEALYSGRRGTARPDEDDE